MVNKENPCFCCRITEGNETKVKGKVFELKGCWVLNHYTGPEGFLGWLVLQPKCHVGLWRDLSRPQRENLGELIGRINMALGKCWGKITKDTHDCIERLYVTYFAESTVNKPKEDHLHIHLIQRSKKLGDGLMEFQKELAKVHRNHPEFSVPQEHCDAWLVPRIRKACFLPKQFLPRERNVERLMKELGRELGDLIIREIPQHHNA